jgi:hypothetical protein
MEKAIIAVASLVMFLSSCSKDLSEIDSENSGAQISINAYLQRSNLKLSVVNDFSLLRGSGFIVNAFNTGSTNWNDGGKNANTKILDQKHIQYSNADNSWSYTPPILWPSNGRVSFFGHTPAGNARFSINADGDAVIRFAQKYNINGYDLLVSYLLDNTKANINNEGKLGFTMKHALARVGFKAKYIASANIRSVEVSEIFIKYSANLISAATLKFTGDNSLDAGINPWVDGQIAGIATENKLGYKVTVGTSFDYIMPILNSNNSKNFMLLIPQNITPGLITISMKITANRTDGSVKTWRITDRDLFVALNRKGITSLQCGKAYCFTFNFNVDSNPDDPNDPSTPIDAENVLNHIGVTETEDWN